MNISFVDTIAKMLENKGILLESGLSALEIREVETRFKFRFPPDLRLLFQTFLPVSKGFYHWRRALDDTTVLGTIEEMLCWPREGILFDVEHGDFWVHRDLPDVSAWGPKPETLETQLETASRHLASYVKLIPIYGHRYVPEMPSEAGNPVFSVYQSDIIYYGDSLVNYFRNEFYGPPTIPETIKRVPFWSDCCAGLFEEDIR